jgi:2-keto-3-deoxy-L-rhamnonate aldolase RhmA
MDTARHYQLDLDLSAHFLTAWIVDVRRMRELGITADYIRHPTTSDNVAVETMLINAHSLMIEKRSAVENLEAILSIGGIDMVQFGPADYSLSIGIPGQWTHPRVKEAGRHVIETASRWESHPGLNSWISRMQSLT